MHVSMGPGVIAYRAIPLNVSPAPKLKTVPDVAVLSNRNGMSRQETIADPGTGVNYTMATHNTSSPDGKHRRSGQRCRQTYLTVTPDFTIISQLHHVMYYAKRANRHTGAQFRFVTNNRRWMYLIVHISVYTITATLIATDSPHQVNQRTLLFTPIGNRVPLSIQELPVLIPQRKQ